MKNMVFFSQKIDGNMIFTDCWKVLVLIFSGIGNIVFFEPKSWWKDDIYWLLKRSCFELFSDGKYGLFLSQEVDGKMIFTGYWEVLVLNFSMMGNTVFSSAKMLMERWYLHGLFELGKYGFSRSESVQRYLNPLFQRILSWCSVFFSKMSQPPC